MLRLASSLTALCLAAAVTAAPAQLYTGLNLIDGTGTPLQRDQALLVEGGRISAIAPMGEHAQLLGPEVEQIDATGLYAMPGLIDTHVHLATSPEDEQPLFMLRRQLYGGITSVRDMAGDMRVLSGLARDTRLGRINGPDVYYAALMAGESFFQDPRPASSARGAVPGKAPWMQAVGAETDMPLAVARAAGTWATGIKIYANLPAREVARIAAEGHRQGLQVWAHSTVFPALPGDVVAAGVDTISHVCRLVFETTGVVPDAYHLEGEPDYARTDPADPRIVAVFRDMQQRGTILDATIGLYGRAQERFEANPDNAGKPFADCPLAFAGNLVKVAREQGVAIATGSDFANPPDAPWPALHDELAALESAAGMAPMELIQAATLTGAEVLGIEAETGSLEVGKRADFLLLEANPLEGMANLASLVLTVKHGLAYARAVYREHSASCDSKESLLPCQN